jgi:diaminobutyrate-2-oxoglutarate transaminase
VLVLRRELDQWEPGEHNGTFRGNNHAFVTATAAIETFWSDTRFAEEVQRKGALVRERFQSIVQRQGPDSLKVKGRGLMIGIECPNGEIAASVCRRSFARNLVIETSGAHSQVVKCLCPLTITDEQLSTALDILEGAFAGAMAEQLEIAAS